jgi:hypothetical protein
MGGKSNIHWSIVTKFWFNGIPFFGLVKIIMARLVAIRVQALTKVAREIINNIFHLVFCFPHILPINPKYTVCASYSSFVLFFLLLRFEATRIQSKLCPSDPIRALLDRMASEKAESL